jgi:hypothetical protein
MGRTYFGIERTAVSSLLNAKDSFDPGDHFVTAGIGRFVQVEAARRHVGTDVALQRRAALRQWRVVIRAHIQLVEVLKQNVQLRLLLQFKNKRQNH